MMTVEDLSKHLDISVELVQKALDNLEQKGLIKKVRDPNGPTKSD